MIYTGAGIGGGEKSSCSTITINGGIVTASVKGGGYWNECNSAAIGNGGQNRGDRDYDVTTVGTIVINGGSVNATGMWWGAGIGGGDEMPIASITINGGIVRAESDSSAGIGNGGAGDGGTITITGGTINAVSESACGIGGGYISDIEKVVITGGDITATSDRGAGIGSCAYQTTAEVTISGGRVTATSNKGDGIGMGDIFRDDLVDFSTGTNGDAVIFASSIADQTGKDSWSGLIFEGNDGKIYGTGYTVDEDLTIPADKTLTIESGKTLTVADGVTLTNNGAIHVNQGGAYSGTAPSGNSIAYQVRWDTDDDGAVDDTTYVPIGQTPSHANGEKASTVENVYVFSGWNPEPTALTETNLFPVYTAQFTELPQLYEVTLPTGEGFTVKYDDPPAAVEYGDSFTFTVNMEKGYFAGENFAVKADGKQLTPNADGSYTVKVSGNVTITVEGIEQDAVMPVISGVTDGGTYYVTQSVTVTDDHLQSVTLNGVPVTNGRAFTLEGNKSETYTIVAIDQAGNGTSCTVTMKPVSALAQPIEGLTLDNVTSAHKADIEAVKAQVAAVDTASATEAEKAALREITDTCDTLLERLEQTSQAGNGEMADKVEGITPDTVKPEDKDDLLAAKEELEEALENFGDNYTQEEKGALEEKLEQINSALDSIEKVEKLESDIAALPETAEPDDLETEALINAVKEQYDALTEHEKSMVSEQMKQKLEVLIADLTDYRVVDGNGGRWTVGSGESLTFTANGAAAKFTGLMVDGVAVDADHYTVRAGSTIVTLKAEYLNVLSAGKHTLTILYADGEAIGEFVILAQNTDGGDTENETTENGPVTGDGTASAALWCVFAFAGVLTVLCYGIKKQYNR